MYFNPYNIYLDICIFHPQLKLFNPYTLETNNKIRRGVILGKLLNYISTFLYRCPYSMNLGINIYHQLQQQYHPYKLIIIKKYNLI